MSRRTSEANRAIATAWEREQKLVKNGQGTRDWSQEQQKSIIEHGKAYDENGKAFEGQHMRSVEIHPEEQGNPDNIQFLTREEHLAAHDGNWQNPTNWYYDPVIKEKMDFGDGPIIPCKVIYLSEPLSQLCSNDDGDASSKDIDDKDKNDESEDRGQQNESQIRQSEIPTKESFIDSSAQSQPNSISPIVQNKKGYKILKGIEKGVKTTGKYVAKAGKVFIDNREVIIPLVLAVLGSVAAAEGKKKNSTSNSSNTNANNSNVYKKEPYDDNATNLCDDSHSCDRNSPQGHTVSPHGQHYHTKGGIIWKEKDAYSRGVKNEDEQ